MEQGKKSADAPRPNDVVEQVWIDWVALRKRKGTTISETAIQGARDEAAKLGWSLEQFLIEWCTRGSQGLKADWVLEKQTASQKAQSNMHQLTRGQTAPTPFWSKTDILEVEHEPKLLR
jgi:hypothetical protein